MNNLVIMLIGLIFIVLGSIVIKRHSVILVLDFNKRNLQGDRNKYTQAHGKAYLILGGTTLLISILQMLHIFQKFTELIWIIGYIIAIIIIAKTHTKYHTGLFKNNRL